MGVQYRGGIPSMKTIRFKIEIWFSAITIHGRRFQRLTRMAWICFLFLEFGRASLLVSRGSGYPPDSYRVLRYAAFKQHFLYLTLVWTHDEGKTSNHQISTSNSTSNSNSNFKLKQWNKMS